MSWEDELRLRINVPVAPNLDGDQIKKAVIEAIEKKLEELPTDAFEDLDSGEESSIVFRTVRKGGP